MPRAKLFLTTHHTTSDNNDKLIRTRETIFGSSSVDDRDILVPLLGYLFPSFPWNDDTFLAGGFNDDEALNDLRVHHSKNFDRYFVFSIGSNDLSQDEFKEFLQALPDRPKAAEHLREYFQRGVLLSLLERLAAYTNNVDLRHIESLLTVLFDISDDCRPTWESGSAHAFDMYYLHICSRILSRIEDFDQRLQLLSLSIANSTGLFLPTSKVSIEEQESSRRTLGLTEDQIQPLRAICLKRIKDWAADGRLIKHHSLGFLLFRWQSWDTASEWKEWILLQTDTKDGLFAISFSQMGRTYSTDGVSYHVQIELLEKLIDIGLVEHKLSQLDRSQLTREECELVELFFLSLKSRKSQKGSEAE